MSSLHLLHLCIHAGNEGRGGGIAQHFKEKKIFQKTLFEGKTFPSVCVKNFRSTCLLVSLNHPLLPPSFFEYRYTRHFLEKLRVYRVYFVVFYRLT